MHSKLKKALLIAVALFVVAQLVPYGRDHANPPVTQEPKWDKPETRGLVKRACFDCHSNQTVWPWYASIAPASWLVASDVEDGRRKLNFTEWDKPQRKAKDAVDVVDHGDMPPTTYKPLHAEANLSDAEKRMLIEGLRATLAADPK